MVRGPGRGDLAGFEAMLANDVIWREAGGADNPQGEAYHGKAEMLGLTAVHNLIDDPAKLVEFWRD